MNCSTILFLAALSFSKAAFADESHWMPSEGEISLIEKKIVLPHGSSDLREYSRYYSGRTDKSGKYVIAVFVLDGHEPGVKIVSPKKMPLVLDGGCTNIDLLYDVKKNLVVNLSCNGSG